MTLSTSPPGFTSAPSNGTRDGAMITATKKKYPTSKPFKCDHCGDSFNQRVHLKKHSFKHTGEHWHSIRCRKSKHSWSQYVTISIKIGRCRSHQPWKCWYIECNFISTCWNSYQFPLLFFCLQIYRLTQPWISSAVTYCGRNPG